MNAELLWSLLSMIYSVFSTVCLDDCKLWANVCWINKCICTCENIKAIQIVTEKPFFCGFFQVPFILCVSAWAQGGPICASRSCLQVNQLSGPPNPRSASLPEQIISAASVWECQPQAVFKRWANNHCNFIYKGNYFLIIVISPHFPGPPCESWKAEPCCPAKNSSYGKAQKV